MIGSLPLVAVGQEHDDTGVLLPLLLGGGDELVDDGLRTLCEVTELSLPRHKSVLAFDGVPVFEADGGVLAEQGIVDPEASLLLGEVLQRGPLVAVHRVDEHRVALDERSAAGVLARQSHRHTVHEQ